MVFERRNVVFNILIDEKTQKNILIMDLMGKRQAPIIIPVKELSLLEKNRKS